VAKTDETEDDFQITDTLTTEEPETR